MKEQHISLLQKIYDPEQFRTSAQDVTALLSTLLKQTLNRDGATIPYMEPKEALEYWDKYTATQIGEIYKDFIDHSIKLHNPRYMGHQVVPPAPDAAIASFIGAMINNGGAVYEMGMASNALEKVVIQRLLPYFGYGSNGGGIMTSGGTLSNLTALLCARSVKGQGVWREGSKERYGIMVSAEAHYCIDRAARIMGWGDDGIIKVPVDDSYRMDTNQLDQKYKEAVDKGIKVIGIVGSAPTTSTGIHDDLMSIGAFAQRHDLWYHIDGAHGGPAVFSDKYKHLMKGCEMADSITVDGHKMMMMPSLTTLLLFKEDRHSYQTFNQEAQYLWGSDEYEWWNAGKRTFECTKLIMSLRFFVIMQHYGIKAFDAFVTQCYDNAKVMQQLLQADERYEIAVVPDTNIVCFRPKHIVTNEGLSAIRRGVLQQGLYYIVQTSLKGDPWLRVSLMNPFTTKEDLLRLLDDILAF